MATPTIFEAFNHTSVLVGPMIVMWPNDVELMPTLEMFNNTQPSSSHTPNSDYNPEKANTR
jgi:hypothetical protein